MDIAAAAKSAPRHPGVYLFFSAKGELLYVGKAGDLRRRLSDHARGSRHSDAVDVRWETCADETEALARESDLIVSLAPTSNMAGRYFHGWSYISIGSITGGVRFEMRKSPGDNRSYGCFPHLGKGLSSHPGTRSNRGYTALLRLLWFAGADSQRPIPRRIAGGSPPATHNASLDLALARPLHEYFSGRSSRLLALTDQAIATAHLPLLTRRVIDRELDAAREFFSFGPRRLRALRLRHRLSPGCVEPDVFVRLVRLEVAEFL